mgnify:CR=1 FL=1
MASVLDVVLESIKASVSASAKASGETFGDAKEVINEENMRRSFSVQVYIDQFSVAGREYQSVVPLHLV